MTDISRWITGHAGVTPDKLAVTDDFQSLTYGHLDQRIGVVSRYLTRALGLAAGDTIAWLGHNLVEQVILVFAAARCGIMISPLNWRLASPELRYIVDDAQVKALFFQDTYASRIAELIPDVERCRTIAAGELAAVTCDVSDLPGSGSMEAPLLLVYTSGTTGQPKGAVLSQQAVLVNALNAQHMHGMTADDHVLTVLPMFHVGGLNIQTLPALYCGASVTLHERFEPARVLQAIGDIRPSLTCLVPATIQALINEPAWLDTDLSSLKAVATGSSDVPVQLIDAIQQRGVPVIQVYGSTETGPVCMYQRPDEAFATTGSIGRQAMHSHIRLVDDDGNDVAAGQPGEILVKGENVASEYWRDVAQSARSFRGGWFHSGDIAACDDDGLYWFKDRIKNVIISGGENIYPAELERVLRSMASVSDAVIVGRNDAKWGQVPVAAVVRSVTALSPAQVLEVFQGRLARYKHPKHVVFLDALPRNAMGKVVIDAVNILVERELGQAHK